MPKSPQPITADQEPGGKAAPVAACYLRVSAEDQTQGYSIPEQRDFCLSQAQARDYLVPEEYILIDDGLPGDLVDRPGLIRLRELARTKQISACFLRYSDRFSREAWLAIMVKKELQRAGVALFIGASQLDYSLMGDLQFAMMAVMDEHARGLMKERTYSGKLRRVEKDKRPGGGATPLGYFRVVEKHGGSWQVDEKEASLVRRIFSMYADEGMSMRAITARLTAEKIPTKSDRNTMSLGLKPKKRHAALGVWHLNSVSAILSYAGYTGTATWRKHKTIERIPVRDEQGRVVKMRDKRQPTTPAERIDFPIPPIIDPDVFARAQERMRRNAAASQANVTRLHKHLLNSRLFRCARCGLGMQAVKLNRSTFYYRCSSKSIRLDKRERCPNMIRADEVEGRIWGMIENLYADPAAIHGYLDQREVHQREGQERLQIELDAVGREIVSYHDELQRIMDAYQAGFFSLADATERRQALDQLQRKREERRDDLQARLTQHGMSDTILKNSIAAIESVLDRHLLAEPEALESVNRAGTEDLTAVQRETWKQDAIEQHAAKKDTLRRDAVKGLLATLALEQKRQILQALGMVCYFDPQARHKIRVDWALSVNEMAFIPT